MNFLPKVFSIALGFSLVGCAPKNEVAGTSKAPPAKVSSAHFVFSAVPYLENLTLEDYAALNREMEGLLRRSGFTSGKGYLIPMPDIHGGTYPSLNVEGDSELGVDLGSSEATKAAVERFTLECKKILRPANVLKEPNQPPQTTTGGSAPSRV